MDFRADELVGTVEPDGLGVGTVTELPPPLPPPRISALPPAWGARLVAVYAEAQTIDVRAFEGKGSLELLASLVPATIRVVDLTVDAFRELGEAYERITPSRPPSIFPEMFAEDEPDTKSFERRVDALVKSSSFDLGDLVFIGLTELRQKRERVLRLAETPDPWEIVAECGSAMRRVLKAVSAIENAIMGPAAKLSFATVLQVSLLVRREYREMRRVILVDEPADLAGARAVLRSIGTRIAMIVGRPIYPSLRTRDRLEMRRLQERILAWLRDGTDLQEARRLFQDLGGFARMISQVSRREELVAHDVEVLGTLMSLLADGPRVAAPELHALALALTGLDDELDELLSGKGMDAAMLTEVVVRLSKGYPALAPRRTIAVDPDLF